MLFPDQMAMPKRWWVVVVLVGIGITGSALATAITAPQYRATCKLFVANAADTTPSETYQGSKFAQERVVAYLDLVRGERVAYAAISALRLDIPATDLVDRIEATAEPNSVLINVSVTDPGAHRSAELANAVCSEFQIIVTDTEAPNQQVVVKLVEKANSPSVPVSPSAARNVTVGALVGLLAGIGFILVHNRVRTTAQHDEVNPPDEAMVVPEAPLGTNNHHR